MQALESARRDKENAEAQLSAANARAQHSQASGASATALADTQARPRAAAPRRRGARVAARPAGVQRFALCAAEGLGGSARADSPGAPLLPRHQAELAELRGRYEALRAQSVADVASRVSAHVSNGSSVPASVQQGLDAADALRRCQAALLREREARVRAEAEGDSLTARTAELEAALLQEQARANDLTRRLLAGIDASRESLAAGAGDAGAAGAGAAPQAVPSAPPLALDERGVPIPPSMLEAAPASRGDGEGATVSAARMAAEEARARAAEAANTGLVREADFLRAKLRSAEADVKAARDGEIKMRAKMDAFASLARGGGGASGAGAPSGGANAVQELERERTRARSAEAACAAATAAAAEAAARASAAEAAAAAAADALTLACAERDAARAALPPPPPPAPAPATPDAGENGVNGGASDPAATAVGARYLSPEAEEALAREAGEKNAVLRECDALQRRVKALEISLVAEKERGRAAELKARARLEAMQVQQAAARK